MRYYLDEKLLEEYLMGMITALKCPECGANISLPDEEKRLLFCPYCGTELEYDDGDIDITINHNLNEEVHFVDHAQIAELKFKEKQEKTSNIAAIICLVIAAIPFIIYGLWYFNGHVIRDLRDKSAASSYIEQGYVCPGKSAEEFVGDKAKSVIKQLKSVGFTNIQKVATGAGLAIWDAGKVTEVMIDGDTKFGAFAYFPPDAPIVVTYK